MMKVNRRLKTKKRLKGLSLREKQNPVLKNIEVAGILSEIHPVAAGVYNTAYFVIINQKKQPARSSEFLGIKSQHIGRMKINNLSQCFRLQLLRDQQRGRDREGELHRHQQGEAQVHLQGAHHARPGGQNLPHSLKHLQLDMVSRNLYI